MPGKADKELMRAVLEPRKPGALKAIGDAVAAGADPNAICAEGSTSSGRVRGGSTLLTHSIHQWASNAVRKLLECGANPNLADENGWTPWMASTQADSSKRGKIQSLLEEYGADKRGEHIGELIDAVYDGDVDKARALIQSDDDLKVLSTFRIDLVGHQVDGNPRMLELLLERGMSSSSTHLTNAIRFNKPEAVDLLLRYGQLPDEDGRGETHLMAAAGMGFMDIVQRLVEAGADVNRCSDEEGEWTASFYARRGGHTEVAEWLQARMGEAARETQKTLQAGRNPKYGLLYEQATASEALSTDDLVAILTEWDQQYGIAVTAASGNSVALRFSELPEKLDRFFEQVIDICPDADDVEGALRKELADDRMLHLWWD